MTLMLRLKDEQELSRRGHAMWRLFQREKEFRVEDANPELWFPLRALLIKNISSMKSILSGKTRKRGREGGREGKKEKEKKEPIQ